MPPRRPPFPGVAVTVTPASPGLVASPRRRGSPAAVLVKELVGVRGCSASLGCSLSLLYCGGNVLGGMLGLLDRVCKTGGGKKG